MNIELLAPFTLVAYTMWATPGPNNMMLVYSGARFGIAATLPHISGILIGTFLLNLLALLGLKPIIDQWPETLLILKIVGSAWLVLIGYKMARAYNSNAEQEEARPMSLIAAALFQFANPKAITATLALVSLALVAIDKEAELFWLVLLCIPPIGLVATLPWALAGRSIRRFLSTDLRWRIFTWCTGGLTASCAIFLWI